MATSVKFQKGDKVRCIKEFSLGHPKLGHLYTVSKVLVDYSVDKPGIPLLVYVNGYPGGWSCDRFEKFEPCKCTPELACEEHSMAASKKTALPVDSAARKNVPMARGLLDYFPSALAEIAAVSKAGNDKHNPGQEMHHARGKSNDHADCILRHLVDRGTMDPDDGQRHTAKVAWRALALLQEELEAAGAPIARGAKK